MMTTDNTPASERKLFDQTSLMILGAFILLSAVMAFAMKSGYQHSRDTALADRYFQQQQYEQAIPYLHAIIERYPTAWMRRKLLGDSYLMSKTPNPKAALEQYDLIMRDTGYQGYMNNTSVNEDDKRQYDLNEAMGICYSQLGEEGKAQDYFARALAQEPDNPAANYYMGVQFFKAGNYRQAAQCFQNAATGDHQATPEVNDTEAPKQSSKWGDYWSRLAEPYRKEIAKRLLEAAPPAAAPAGKG